MERRRVLRLTGASAIAAFAGCSGDNGDDDEGDGDDSTPTRTETGVATANETADDESGGAESDAAEPEGEASSDADGLRIASHDIYPVEDGDNEGLANIDGTVVNERDSSVDYVEVVGRTYGEYEDEYYAKTEDLDAGGEWAFTVEMSSYYEDIERYEVVVNDEPMFGAD